MKRAAALLGLAVMAAGCSMTPSVTKERMTLADTDISGMECRRILNTGTSIAKTMCANPESWKRYDTAQAEKSQTFLDDVRDGNDNRMLYPR
jgi:hypothetical protein